MKRLCLVVLALTVTGCGLSLPVPCGWVGGCEPGPEPTPAPDPTKDCRQIPGPYACMDTERCAFNDGLGTWHCVPNPEPPLPGDCPRLCAEGPLMDSGFRCKEPRNTCDCYEWERESDTTCPTGDWQGHYCDGRWRWVDCPEPVPPPEDCRTLSEGSESEGCPEGTYCDDVDGTYKCVPWPTQPPPPGPGPACLAADLQDECWDLPPNPDGSYRGVWEWVCAGAQVRVEDPADCPVPEPEPEPEPEPIPEPEPGVCPWPDGESLHWVGIASRGFVPVKTQGGVYLGKRYNFDATPHSRGRNYCQLHRPHQHQCDQLEDCQDPLGPDFYMTLPGHWRNERVDKHSSNPYMAHHKPKAHEVGPTTVCAVPRGDPPNSARGRCVTVDVR